MDTAIRKAYEVFGFANQQELNEWDLERRREKASFDMGSRLSSARREGEQIGRREGEQIGRQEGSIEIARNALAEGATPEFVQKITGLPSEIITKL